MNWTLSGYKVYLAALLLAAIGVAEGVFGIDIPGVEVADNWVMMLLGSLGLGGLKAAISKV